jgi:hypothetical protein
MNDDLKPITVRRRTAARLLDIGVTKLDEEISKGTIAAKKSGKVLLILYSSLDAYAQNLPDAELKLPAHIRRKLDAIAPVAAKRR